MKLKNIEKTKNNSTDLDRLFSGFCRVLFESRVQGTKSRYQKTFSAWSKWTCFQSWVLKMIFILLLQKFPVKKSINTCSLAFWHFWHHSLCEAPGSKKRPTTSELGDASSLGFGFLGCLKDSLGGPMGLGLMGNWHQRPQQRRPQYSEGIVFRAI